MWSQNHACRELREPALGKAIPFAKLLGFRTREEIPLFSYFFLQVHNKTDTRVLWFSVRKFEKKSFLVFVLINFTTSLGFKKFFLTYQKDVFGISEEKIQEKMVFHSAFLLKTDDILFWIKNEKMNVLFVFFKKIYLWKW